MRVAVQNAGDALGVSIHVYSPPLTAMDYYVGASHGGLVTARRDAGGWDVPPSWSSAPTDD